MRLCFLGAYDPTYPRNSVLKQGLRMNGVEVSECRLPPKYKFWLRYPLLVSRYAGLEGRHDFLFVPEFCQKDVPLAKLLSLVFSKKLIFDPLASRFETKIIDWRRKPEDSLQAWWNYEVDLLALRMSDLILADTQAHKNYYCQKYGLAQDKVEVLPIGYDDQFFKPRRASFSKGKKHGFEVLFYGSFLPLHGVEVIIQAARILHKKDRSVHFRFVGSGQTLPSAKAAASDFGLSNVEFEDWIPQSKLQEKIESADICLGIFGQTEKSRRVIPHKIFQAMGMKRAVITLRTPAVEEFFSHGENIFLSSEPCPDLLAQVILELKRDETLRDKIAQNGYEVVREKFTPQAIGRLFREILERKFSNYKRG